VVASRAGPGGFSNLRALLGPVETIEFAQEEDDAMTFSQNYFLIFVSDGSGKGKGQPLIIKKQLLLFIEKAGAEHFAVKSKQVPPGYVFSSTETWDNLMKILEWAEKLGADSVAFVSSGKDHHATTIAEVIDNVRDVVTGKHYGNPTNPN
jgi:hypothetical protein